MYLINKQSNRISKLEVKGFKELGFYEREHLQEWLANNPGAFGEELLIIQKEFDGFNDTNERLDLLALDKQGNVVVIENKLDDSGRNVTWQVLKYASYCSSLSKEQIKEIYQDYLNKSLTDEKAEEKLSEFFDNTEFDELILNSGPKQRIIMVSGNFRKEVTSTVLWLMNYKIRIQCFKVTPFALGEQLFLNIEQILPIKEAEEFSIRMADKIQNDISSQETLKSGHNIRTEFWTEFIKEANKVNSLFKNISPMRESWIGLGIGLSGVNINLVITKSYARSEIYINRGDQEENKKLFDFLFQFKNNIEEGIGESLIWERMDENVTSRIKYELTGVNVFDKEDWKKMIQFLIKSSAKMERAFKEPVNKLSLSLRKK